MNKPKILFFDVETKPVLAWIWGCGSKIRIGHEQIKAGEKFDIICICYKWHNKAGVTELHWDKNQDSAKMLEQFANVLEQADVVVAHNGDKFDIKQINTQRLLHNQEPLSWPTSEDTLKQLRKFFAFPSYKLDYVAKLLTGSGKDQMAFQDWIDIVENKSEAALSKMIRYCKRDVIKLEDIFSRTIKYMTPKVHAGIAMGNDSESCPRCGSEQRESKGYRLLLGGRYKRYQCLDCAHSYRSNRKV